MGGAVSSGVDNDSLVDNLIDGDYIKTAKVERVFRAVDRGFYFTNHGRSQAYRDVAWKDGNLHLSAPCIYSRVMEYLELQPGNSFLNIGSGTGYLSTMAGLMIGPSGINHGVEIHADVVAYAEKKLEEFKATPAIDEFDFSEPLFCVGNCLSIPAGSRRYDRVYCGAACPVTWKHHIQSLVEIGGILIIPVEDQLLKFTRKSETNWESKNLLSVSFANLVLPGDQKVDTILPPCDVPSLQSVIRLSLRREFRKQIDAENPDLWKCMRRSPPTRRTATEDRYRSFSIVPFSVMTDSDDGDGDSDAEPGFVTRFTQGGELIMRIARELANREERDESMRADRDEEEDSFADSEEEDHDMSDAENEGEEAERDNEENGHSEESIEMESGKQPRDNEENGHSEESIEMESGKQPRDNEENGHSEESIEMESEEPMSVTVDAPQPSSISSQTNTTQTESSEGPRRLKFDSGVSDLFDESSGSDNHDDHSSTEPARPPTTRRKNRRAAPVEEKTEQPRPPVGYCTELSEGQYTILMKSKIQSLPLPPPLKSFLNYYRSFE